MGDLVSLVGLAAGLVSLGLQACGGITTYLDAVQCRDEDIASVRRQNDTLRKVLLVVDTSLSHLQSEDQAPVAGCFQSCEIELKALESLIAELAGRDTSKASLKDRIKNQNKKLSYPFNRPKLQQLENRLNQANGTLQLALQSLGIKFSLSTIDKLTTIESTSQGVSAGLLVTQAAVAALNPPLLEIRSRFPSVQSAVVSVCDLIVLEAGTLSSRILEGNRSLREDVLVARGSLESSLILQQEQLNRIESQSAIQQARLDSVEYLLKELRVVHSSPDTERRSKVRMTREEVVGRLIAKPRNLKQICDELGVTETVVTNPNPSARCSLELSADRGTFRPSDVASLIRNNLMCSCRPFRRLKRKSLRWGPLDLYSETSAKEHLPGCAASQANNHNRAIGLRFTGLPTLLKSAIKISFAMSSGAGGRSISPTFTYYPTVDGSNAPAFRVLHVIEDFIDNTPIWVGEESLLTSVQWGQFVALGLSKILKLFQDRRATPRAVDSRNRSLNHYVAYLISRVGYSPEDSIYPLIEVLRTLILYDVPATDYDVDGM